MNENNQERAGESLDKEYDEQEADDEIDEESDAPAEPHAIQRNAAKKDAMLRAQQRLRLMNQQQDSHRIHYSQHSPKLYQAHPSATRFVIQIFYIRKIFYKIFGLITVLAERKNNRTFYNLLAKVIYIVL